VALAVCTLLSNEFSARSIVEVSGPVLSVLQRTEVVWIAIFSTVVLRERTNGRFWFGAGLAGAGLWLLYDPVANPSSLHALGLMLGLLSAIVFSVMAVITRKYIHEVRPVRLNLQRLLVSLPLCMLAGANVQQVVHADKTQLWFAALAGLCGPVLSRLCLMQSARYVPAHMTAMIVQLAPLFTVALGFLLFGELPAPREWGGGALMLAGVVLTVVPFGSRPRPI